MRGRLACPRCASCSAFARSCRDARRRADRRARPPPPSMPPAPAPAPKKVAAQHRRRVAHEDVRAAGTPRRMRPSSSTSSCSRVAACNQLRCFGQLLLRRRGLAARRPRRQHHQQRPHPACRPLATDADAAATPARTAIGRAARPLHPPHHVARHQLERCQPLRRQAPALPSDAAWLQAERGQGCTQKVRGQGLDSSCRLPRTFRRL